MPDNEINFDEVKWDEEPQLGNVQWDTEKPKSILQILAEKVKPSNEAQALKNAVPSAYWGDILMKAAQIPQDALVFFLVHNQALLLVHLE